MASMISPFASQGHHEQGEDEAEEGGLEPGVLRETLQEEESQGCKVPKAMGSSQSRRLRALQLTLLSCQEGVDFIFN